MRVLNAQALILLVVSVLTSHTALAQISTLSLEEAVQIGMRESPRVQLAKASKDEATAQKLGARSGFLPKLNFSALKYVEQKYQTFDAIMFGNSLNFPIVMPKSDARLSFDMPLFNGLKNYNDYRAASLGESVSENLQSWDQFVLKRNIKEAFYRALAAVELLKVATENIVTLEDHFSHVESRKKGGLATSYDVLRIEVQLDEARTRKIEAEDRVVISRKEIFRLMGTPTDDREIIGELPVPTEDTRISKLDVNESLNRQDLEALRMAEQAAAHKRNSAGSWFIPQIGITADYDWYNNSNYSWTQGDQYKNAYGVGLYLRWNLFDGGGSMAASQQSAAQLSQSQARLKMEEQKLPVSLENFKRRYIYGTALYKMAVSDIKKSEESVRQAKEGAKQGVRTVSEQLDAQLDLFRSRAGKVNAQLISAEAVINLELTTGKELLNETL